MKNFKIFIPSYSRWQENELHTISTINRQMPEHKDKIVIVVDSSEFKQYKKRYEEYSVLDSLQDGEGIGAVRKFIIEFSKQNGIEWAFMIDDDLKAVVFPTEENGKIMHRENNSIDPFSEMLDSAEKMSISMLGLTYESSYRHLIGFKDKKTNEVVEGKIYPCGYASGACLVNVEDIHSLGNYDERLRLFEDTDMNIRLRKDGKKIRCYRGGAGKFPPLGSLKGGCQASVYSNDSMKTCAEMFARKHSDFAAARVVRRKDRAERYMTFVQWRKLSNAYKES
jgi:GT2 family glycosyltransferase